MALEINAQYTMFVQFAQQQADAEHSKVIARVGGEGPLGGRDIKAAERGEGDSVRPFLPRSGANKNKNNAVRDLFRQAIREMFGGEERIPPNVKEAMRLQDYGDGRPLTARRIMAVKAAVDEVLGRVAPALQQAKLNAASLYAPAAGVPEEERHNTVDSLLDTLVRTTAVDPDALEVAVANAARFARSGNAELRTAEAIQAKGRNLLAAVGELRTLAKGDRALFELGKTFLREMNGTDIPEGFVRGLVEASKRVRIAATKGLSASSTGKAVHKAVCEFSDNLRKITDAVAAEDRFEGAEEKRATRNFAAALILHRFNAKEARNVVAAMGTVQAGTLSALYAQVGIEEFDKQGHSPGLVQHTSAQAVRLNDTMDSLNLAAQARLGIPLDDMARIPDVEQPDYRTIDGGRILDSLLDRGRAAAAEHRARFARNAVAGEGPAADKLRAVYADFGEPEAFNLELKLATMRNGIVRSMLNGQLCEQCQKLAGPNPANSQFGQDADRDLVVKLPGDQRLENDFALARDRLASFVTNGAKATYASLDEREKGKTHVLMALLNQRSVTSLQSGETLSLDPQHRNSKIWQAGPSATEFSIAFGPDGTLSVTCKSVFSNLNMITIVKGGGNDEDLTDLDPATKIEMEFTLNIKADEFDRLASLDYTAYDPDAVDQMILDPNVENPHAKYGEALGEPFAFRTDNSMVSCTSSYKITIA